MRTNEPKDTYKDDEIEVLGLSLQSRTSNKHRPAWIWIGAWMLLVAAAVAAFILFRGNPSDKEEQQEISEISTSIEPLPIDDEQPDQEAVSTETIDLPYLNDLHDSINDVPFRIYDLKRTTAKVVFEMPDTTDENVMLVTQAADIRADNGEINCEFIIDRQQRTRGTRKQGWCYVAPDGNVTIGIGAAEDIKQRALDEGGCFFRQLALVMDGEIMPNNLKGKSLRRALAFYRGEPTIVTSDNRESLYDFSQALADYGFSHALYLPGGRTRWLCRGPDGVEFDDILIYSNQNITYLVFSK